ncbi:MAG: arginine deiminase-related protein [Pseudomonadota bacterium]
MSAVQTANTVFAVRPVRFQSNPLTRASNAFQAREPLANAVESNRIARAQFDGLVDVLDRCGVQCLVFDDTSEPHTPDSIFPNNWISTHTDGRVVLYPMEAPNRRTERRQDIIESLQHRAGFVVSETVDLSPLENDGVFLEGTGSLVLDRGEQVAYACLSTRTHQTALDAFDEALGYQSIRFRAADVNGLPVYHTNVMMCVGADFAVVCDASIIEEDREQVLANLERTGKQLIQISHAQMNAFAGNMLALRDSDGESVIALSQQAFDSLADGQQRLLESFGNLAIADIAHIEQESGGSVRCMLAEVHFPTARQ